VNTMGTDAKPDLDVTYSRVMPYRLNEMGCSKLPLSQLRRDHQTAPLSGRASEACQPSLGAMSKPTLDSFSCAQD
jgi:hypothetical protein